MICPYCRNRIADSALRCRHCRHTIKIAKANKRFYYKLKYIVLCLVCASAAIFVIFWCAKQNKNFYSNNTYGIVISYPNKWQIIDSNHHYDLYRSLKKDIGTKDHPVNLICAFTLNVTLKVLNPLITIASESMHTELSKLSVEDFQKILDYNIQQYNNDNVTEYPNIINIGDKQFIRYSTTVNKWELEWENVYYYIRYDDKLYTITCSAKKGGKDYYDNLLYNMLMDFKF